MVAVTIATPLSAHAALITVQIDGLVDTVDATHNVLPFSNVQPGQNFSIRYTIDSATPDADLPDPTHGNYLGGIPSMTVTINGEAFLIPDQGPPVFVDGYLSIRNDSVIGTSGAQVRDNLTYFRQGCATAVGPCYAGTVLLSSQADPPLLTLTTDDLVTTPSFYAQFATQQLSLRAVSFSAGATDQVFGHITGVHEVPLPGTAWLLLSGFSVFALSRHTSPNSRGVASERR
jgi:hypothetical protein